MTDSRWTDALPDSARLEGDPIADEAIAEAFALGQVGRVNDLIAEFDENSEAVPPGLPPLLSTYFRQTSDLPDWADPVALERGSELWGRYAPHMVTILHCYSLPACYACAKGAEVLNRSVRMHGQVSRRIMETAQFLNDVVDKGGLGPRGRGFRSAQKIRLLHATIRHFLGDRQDWNEEVLGLPINQEDLVGTMCTFAVVVPEGLVKLGVDLSDQDREGFFHLWCVVGHLLGVNARLIPEDFADGKALLDTIMARQSAPSEAGQRLAKALIEYMQNMTGPALAGAAPTMVRHLAGDEIADILAVPQGDWTSLAIQLQSGGSLAYGRAGDTSELVAELSSRVGALFLKTAVKASNRGNRYDWTIPESEAAHAGSRDSGS